jgi:hypothetical protein
MSEYLDELADNDLRSRVHEGYSSERKHKRAFTPGRKKVSKQPQEKKVNKAQEKVSKQPQEKVSKQPQEKKVNKALKTQEGVAMYLCHQCEKTYKSKSGVIKHIQTCTLKKIE